MHKLSNLWHVVLRPITELYLVVLSSEISPFLFVILHSRSFEKYFISQFAEQPVNKKKIEYLLIDLLFSIEKSVKFFWIRPKRRILWKDAEWQISSVLANMGSDSDSVFPRGRRQKKNRVQQVCTPQNHKLLKYEWIHFDYI